MTDGFHAKRSRCPLWRGAIAFFILSICCVAVLTATAGIPQSAIRRNMLQSAEFLCEGELFGDAIDGIAGSRIDRYADSILLGIVWQYDPEDRLGSVMRSAYYHVPYQNENENLLAAVTEGKAANQQYLRYWHGSIAVVRPLLTVMSLEEIYRFNGIVLIGSAMLLIIVLLRRHGYTPAAGLLAGMILTSAWFVPCSLEYTWMFLLMLIDSLIILGLAWMGKREWYGIAFLCFGMIANFFDFLTTETLTLTVPLLLVLWVEKRKEGIYPAVLEDRIRIQRKAEPVIIRALGAWGVGYAANWILKWVLASWVLGENVSPYVAGHVAERIGMTGQGAVGSGRYLAGTLLRNVKCLFPIEYGMGGILAWIMLMLGCLYLAFVYRKDGVDNRQVLRYAMIAAIPYVRYLILLNHSYLHYFFTYRAQFSTVLAVVMILDELGVWETIRRVQRRGKKTG
ncbi:MAG: hypothetical protein J6M66_08625 [Lachnospiraceae bacterium]|nr:hypothetical protein [Lachnospiraceae bacterium]